MKIREAEVLQAAAVAVAAPRYMGAFAYAIGISLPVAWGWFATVEILSGLAMALLEGWAVAYISRRWQGIPRGTMRHTIVGVFQAVLLLMLPLTALPYLVGMNVSKPTIGIMPIAAIWAWEFVVAAVSPLIAAAVGYVDSAGDTGDTPAVQMIHSHTAHNGTSGTVRHTNGTDGTGNGNNKPPDYQDVGTFIPRNEPIPKDNVPAKPPEKQDIGTFKAVQDGTRRERIATMRGNGDTVRHIADTLGISTTTVQRELKSIKGGDA